MFCDPDAPNKSEFEIRLDRSQGLTSEQLDTRVRAVFDDFPNQLVEIYSVRRRAHRFYKARCIGEWNLRDWGVTRVIGGLLLEQHQ